jgi:hypothetical protein
VAGGQAEAHDPEQTDLVAVSAANMCRVKPCASTSTLPSEVEPRDTAAPAVPDVVPVDGAPDEVAGAGCEDDES